MQDRYTADVGDFGKFGLLRHLAGIRVDAEPKLRLGVIWYLTDDAIVASDPANDGKHISYLEAHQEAAFRRCDPVLYDSLRQIVLQGARRVASVRKLGLLGGRAHYVEERIRTPQAGTSRAERLRVRNAWHAQALEETRAASLVFLDPDNGLEPASVKRHQSKAPKFAYLSELTDLVKRRQSVVCYHHLGRSGTHVEQIAQWKKRLAAELALEHEPLAVRFRRGTARAYFIIPSDSQRDLLERRLETFMSGAWAQHFSLP